MWKIQEDADYLLELGIKAMGSPDSWLRLSGGGVARPPGSGGATGSSTSSESVGGYGSVRSGAGGNVDPEDRGRYLTAVRLGTFHDLGAADKVAGPHLRLLLKRCPFIVRYRFEPERLVTMRPWTRR